MSSPVPSSLPEPPSPIDGITTTVDDLTINIGADGTPTSVVNAAGDGINQSGAGEQPLVILESGSSVTGSADGVNMRVTGGAGDLSLSSQGDISGGTTLIVVDPTGFAVSGVFLGSLANTVFNTIEANGYRPDSSVATRGVSRARNFGIGPGYWLSGFGGAQTTQAGTNNINLAHNYVGLLIGAETGADNGTFGLVGGYGMSNLDIAFDAGDVTAQSVFGAAYWKMDYGTHRFQLAIVAGITDLAKP